MSKVRVPPGISLDRAGDNFVLRRKVKRRTVAIKFSAEELIGIKGTIDLWINRLLSQSRTGSGAVQAVLAYSVAQAMVVPDAIEANALLTVRGPQGGEITLALPPPVAEHVANAILAALPRLAMIPKQ